MREAGRAVIAVVATALLLAGTVALAPMASAHDVLLSTDPPDGARVAAAPSTVVLTFDKPALALGTEILVTGPGGALVSGGPPRLINATVSQNLGGTLEPGGYVVTWRVTSADGHPVSGRFGFTATGAGHGALATLPTATPASPTKAAAASGTGTGTGTWLIAGTAVLLVVAGGLAVAVSNGYRRRRDPT